MASRKHARPDSDDYTGKRPCQVEVEDRQGPVLKYNPGFLTQDRTCGACPGYTREELKVIAKSLGIKTRGMTKAELVKAIRACPLA